MNTTKAIRNAKFLEALEYIDPSIIAQVAENIKAPDITPASGKSKVMRSLKYVAALAACLLLLGAVMPLVQYLSDNLQLILPSHTLGETSEFPDISSQVIESEFDTESEETTDRIEDTTYLGYLEYDGIEPISEEKMLEVRRAWAEWVYQETYKYYWETYYKYPDLLGLTTEQEVHEDALRRASSLRDQISHRWFNKRVEGLPQSYIQFNRYYGTINEYVVLYNHYVEAWMENQANLWGEWTFNGVKVYRMIYLYKDGEFIEFNQAYNNGLINQDQANQIIRRHQLYLSNHDAWWAEEKSKLTD